MPTPKKYPHEKLIDKLKREYEGFDVSDIDDTDIRDSIQAFAERRPKGYDTALDETSEAIAEEIREYIETHWEEEEAEQEPVQVKAPEVKKPELKVPHTIHPPVVDLPAKSNIPKENVPTPVTNTSVSNSGNMSKGDAALDKLFKEGKTEGITLETLKNVGFPTGFWSNLSSTGWTGRIYILSKKINDVSYNLRKR